MLPLLCRTRVFFSFFLYVRKILAFSQLLLNFFLSCNINVCSNARCGQTTVRTTLVQRVVHFLNSHLFVFLLAGVTFVTRARERKKGTTFCAQHVNRVASNKFGLFFVVSLFLCVSFNVAALLALSVSITAHGGVAIELRVRKKIQK